MKNNPTIILALVLIFSTIFSTAFLIINKPLLSSSSRHIGKLISTRLSKSHHPSSNLILASSNQDDDLTDRSLSFLGTVIKGLSKEFQVPSILIPPHANEPQGTTTTLQGWYALAAGLSLTLGNPVYPSAFLGFLYLSRPVDAPDWSAAIAAAVVSGIVSPLLESIGDATGLDDSFLARIPFVLGLFVSAAIVREVIQEGDKAFVQPGKQEKERIPALKNERDIRFFDVKLQNKSTGSEAEVGVQVKETIEEAKDVVRKLEDKVTSNFNDATSDDFAKVVEED